MNTEVDDEIWHGDWLVEYTTSALDGDHHHLTTVHGQTVASAQAALFEEIKRLYSDQGAVEVTLIRMERVTAGVEPFNVEGDLAP